MKSLSTGLIIVFLCTTSHTYGDNHSLLNPKAGRLLVPTHHGNYLDPKTGRLMVPAHNGNYLDPKTGQIMVPMRQGNQPGLKPRPVTVPTYDKDFLTPGSDANHKPIENIHPERN